MIIDGEHIETLGYALRCPGCGCDNLHHFRTEVYVRESEDAETGTRADVYTSGGMMVTRSMRGNPSSRRNGVRLLLSCEQCPSISELTIAQHKGTTYLETSVTATVTNDDGGQDD